MNEILSVYDVVRMIEERKKEVGSYRKMSFEMGVSPAFLSRVLHGDSHPSSTVLEYLGLERITRYRKKRRERD